MRSRSIEGTAALRRSAWYVMCTAFLVVGLAPGAAGQTPAEETTEAVRQSRLRMVSEPSGAMVTLEGVHRWRGTTPWEIERDIAGKYEVRVELKGYEDWSREIDLRPGEDRELTVKLARKQAWKAAARSLLVPGWGQFYADERGKGYLFLLGAAAGGIAIALTEEDYQDRVDDYRAARNAYFGEDRLEELPALRARADRERRDADRAYDRRQVALLATGAIYAISLLDAALFFPEPAEGSFADFAPWGDEGPRLGIASRGADGVALLLSLSGSKGGSR